MLEAILLTLAILFSVSYFVHAIYKRLRLLRLAKGVKYSFKQKGRRFLNVLLKVVLQICSIQTRPVTGIMHAFVAWGFFLFLIVTVAHFLTGYNVNFFESWKAFKIYRLIVAGFAIAVLIGIIYLAVRRFIIRPPALGEFSISSGLVALLIVILMKTYLLGFKINPETILFKINWWIHSLSILGFLFLIPHSKHLHIIFAPFNLFFKSPVLAQLDLLDFEKEEFGIERLSDLNKKNVFHTFTCVECGRCQDNCPANITGKRLSPKTIILDIRKALLKRQRETQLLEVIDKELLWQCTTCAACEKICPTGVEHLPVLIGIRRAVVATGEIEEKLARLFRNIEYRGNVWGYPPDERINFIESLNVQYFDAQRDDYLLWLGCAGSFDDDYKNVTKFFVSILKKAGVKFGILKQEKCTADVARRLGNEFLFQQLAQENIENLGKAGVRNIIVSCPHCFRTLNVDYKDLGADFNIIHVYDFLNVLDLKLRPLDIKLIYHDPCYLSRYLGVYKEPRVLLKRCGVKLREAPRSKSRSFCCGGGGGMSFLEEKEGKRISHERLDEIINLKVKTVATGCPFCLTMLKDAATVKGVDLAFKDVIEIVKDACI